VPTIFQNYVGYSETNSSWPEMQLRPLLADPVELSSYLFHCTPVPPKPLLPCRTFFTYPTANASHPFQPLLSLPALATNLFEVLTSPHTRPMSSTRPSAFQIPLERLLSEDISLFRLAGSGNMLDGDSEMPISAQRPRITCWRWEIVAVVWCTTQCCAGCREIRIF